MRKCITQDTGLAFNFHRLFPLVTLIATGYVLWSLGSVARAQEPPSETLESEKSSASVEPADPRQEAPQDQPISLGEVPGRAEITIAELATLLPSDSSRLTLERVGSETDRTLGEVTSQLAKTRRMLAGRPNVRILQKSSAVLSEMLKHLRSLEEELDDELEGFGITLGRIDRIAAVWTTTDELAKAEEGTDATILTRIAAVLGEIDETRSAVVDRRNALLTVRDKLVNPSVALGEEIEQLQTAVESRLAGIFRAEHPPLWNPRVRESFRKEWQTIGPQLLTKRFEESGQASRKPTQTLGFQLLLFLALGLTLRWLREQTRTRADVDNRLQRAQLVFEHPWAMAVLITTVLLTIPLDPLAPRSAGFVAAAFIAVATVRIVQRY